MARPSKRGFGEIDRLPSGKYRARYTHQMKRHSALRTFTHKKYAEAWLAKERELIDRGEGSSPAERLEAQRREGEQAKRNTFALYAEEYLTSRSLRPATVTNYRAILNNRLLPALGDKPLTKIRVADVKAWKDRQPKGTPSQNAAAYRLGKLFAQWTKVTKPNLVCRCETSGVGVTPESHSRAPTSQNP